ncbi:unnamed protein product, partial [Meganyctiphanes norvegica]
MAVVCAYKIFTNFIVYITHYRDGIWLNKQPKDHPSTIKKRCISVFFMTLISPFFILIFGNDETKNKASLWELMGIRSEGFLASLFLPLILTAILFLGPIVQSHQNSSYAHTLQMYCDPRYWYSSAQNPIWWRNQVVAPFSEEFTFRACMLPLLLQCMTPGKVIFVAPLFFGVAHLHHAVERMSLRMDLTSVVIISCFQFCYTSIFGFYSAFLFIRTGHFLPLFAVHAFCNHMGLPELKEVFSKPEAIRNKLLAAHVAGLVAWYFLLYPLTEPTYYSNTLYVL